MAQQQVTPAKVSRRDVGLRSERGPVLLSVMMSVALVAIDATILSTAVPSIVRQLGGFAQFPWLFSVYLLAQAVSVPIYGKLSDQFGRKPIMLIGVGLFVLGSVLCGVAWNMGALIAFRAVQGLGAGAVQPISMTIIGDLYSVAERATVQGYVASVWGVASVIGPTLGGVFSDFLSWRWIFFVNVPVGAVAAWLLARRFREEVTPSKHRIDFAGSALLTVGASLLILGLLEGGVVWSWTSPVSIAVFAVGVVLLVGFGLNERRAAEPILPGWVFRRRILNGTNLTSLTVGMLLIGLTSYIPLFVQNVLGANALIAGFAVAALSLGWPIAASQAGRLYLRIGFRNTALIGSVLVVVGTALLLLLDRTSSVFQVGATCFVIGLGMGLVASPTLVAAQSTVDWRSRGVVTGTNMFARSMGSAVGIAVFGAIANATIARAGGSGTVVAHSGSATGVPVAALESAVHDVYVGSAVIAVLMVVAVLLVPRHVGDEQR
ncbi:EmrB/QacA subfamily drug resistance transporter [Friedmanniella endophytica]|uniref:EmrB/QacA subfamily drug resistance transporter n=1 Tax=Microlunatus kandeliicorticis TaxID=1759536 RepID=A0A7W3IT33_9ACTN|nr:MDR family MFS transporter [Microlunatus kandeliicorticis]MBA8794703.1 EmrB/QacA subfamily drug resistance transporter [Microlunatus kandeliicorticis]